MTVEEMAERTQERRRGRPGATGVLTALALLIGLGLGHWGLPERPVRAADPATPAATVTRAAELAELDALHTQVAATVVCTPAPTETATATPTPEPTATQVPAVAPETVIAYGDAWQITVHSIQTVATPEGVEANGVLVKVSLTFANVSDSGKTPPFADWRLVDATGKRYKASLDATSAAGTRAFGQSIPPHSSADREIVFDVAVDAGTSFVLESTKDPSFRVQLDMGDRG